MKSKNLYSLLGIGIVTFVVITAFTSNDESTGKTNKDIIKFSHKFHIELTDCASCHSKVAEAVSLKDRLMPSMEDCAVCHDIEDDENCTQCHYEEVMEPLIQSDPKLLFNHSFHVSEQNVECQSCHKGLDQVDYSFEAVGVKPMMNDCTTCHNYEAVATNACEACHISTVDLLPADHKTAAFFDQHKFFALNDNQNCTMCHDNAFCETCHVATNMINEKNTANDFYTPYSPHKLTDNAKQQQITRIHSIDYVYSHGIDAQGKTTECRTCHEMETFCVECHNSSNGDFAIEGFVPYSHTIQNFVTIGVGTGGGEHAILAKRDIESCAACHDTYGADPNCILCHVDSDGIKGTNPRTHASGFMRDSEEGDWHTDYGSVCYNCHTDSNAHPGGIRGVGFCGYCHGS